MFEACVCIMHSYTELAILSGGSTGGMPWAAHPQSVLAEGVANVADTESCATSLKGHALIFNLILKALSDLACHHDELMCHHLPGLRLGPASMIQHMPVASHWLAGCYPMAWPWQRCGQSTALTRPC